MSSNCLFILDSRFHFEPYWTTRLGYFSGMTIFQTYLFYHRWSSVESSNPNIFVKVSISQVFKKSWVKSASRMMSSAYLNLLMPFLFNNSLTSCSFKPCARILWFFHCFFHCFVPLRCCYYVKCKCGKTINTWNIK